MFGKKKRQLQEEKKSTTEKEEDELSLVSSIVLLLKKEIEFMKIDLESIKTRFKKKIPMNEEVEEKEDIKNPTVFLPSETGI